MSYNRLDLSTLSFKEEPTPFNEAIKDTEPFDWEQDVLDGKRKIRISKQPKGVEECANVVT